MQLSVCFFGSYDRHYSRNSILEKGLLLHKTKIYHCNNKNKYFLLRYIPLIRTYLRIAKNVSIILVPFPGHLDMPIAWLLAKLTRKVLVFDPYISLYETYVFDRESYSSKSLMGRWYWLIDKISLHLADYILTDTEAHALYYQNTFGIHNDKFKRVFVGAEEIFKPSTKKSKKTIVEFHGYFTKLQGAEIFVEASKKLENKKNIEFWLIGKAIGSTKATELMEKIKPKTLKYFQQMSTHDLAKKVSQAHITVGHLGSTEKASNVISNKTFHGLASKNAVIAINSKANKEILFSNKTAILIEPGNSKSLAEEILRLVKDNALRLKIAEAGYVLFKRELAVSKVGKRLKKILDSF